MRNRKYKKAIADEKKKNRGSNRERSGTSREKITDKSHANYSNPGKYGEIIAYWNTFYEVN